MSDIRAGLQQQLAQPAGQASALAAPGGEEAGEEAGAEDRAQPSSLYQELLSNAILNPELVEAAFAAQEQDGKRREEEEAKGGEHEGAGGCSAGPAVRLLLVWGGWGGVRCADGEKQDGEYSSRRGRLTGTWCALPWLQMRSGRL